MPRVLITGGTGLVGRHLAKKLLKSGYDVATLGRNRKQISSTTHYTWNWKKGIIEQNSLDSANYIIHLAGANIGDRRWTTSRRQLIINSRIKTGELIFDSIHRRNSDLRAFISASAIGIYGAVTSDKIFEETDPAAKDFLGKTCQQWEKVADQFRERGTRSVTIRTAVVLTRKGGALSKMTTPIRMGIGSAIGSGKQYLPWIHIDDLCNIYIKAIEDTQMRGTYNAVAPDHKTNEAFNRTLARVLEKPFLFPNIPAFAMKAMFGKMSEIILEGSRISADKIRSAGYRFQFPTLEAALIDLFK